MLYSASVRPPPLILLLVAQASIVGCGGLSDEYLESDSRRIVSRSLRAPGIPPWQTELYDVEFRTTCTFATASDGRLRCLPHGTLSGSRSYFDDAACTHPLFWHLSGGVDCPLTSFAASTRHCRTRIHHAAVRDTTKDTVYVARGSECQAEVLERLTPDPDDPFILGEEISPEAFVLGEEFVQPLTTLLSERFVRTPDGARQSRGVFLAQWGPKLGCAPSSGPSGGPASGLTCWAAPSATVQTRYLDSECTDSVEVGVAPRPCFDAALEPWAIRVEDPYYGPGASSARYFALSEPIARPLYTRSPPDDLCQPAIAEKRYSLGLEAALPRVLLEETLMGTGRLQRVVYHHEGEVVRFGRWRDRDLDHTCDLYQDLDDAWRCVPSGALASASDEHLYADELRRWRVYPGGDDAAGVLPGSWLVTLDENRRCLAGAHLGSLRSSYRVIAVHRVANRHFGPIYGDGDATEPRSPGTTPYFLLDEVPLTDFPQLRAVID